MKKALLIHFLVFASAFGGYWIYYRSATAHSRAMLSQEDGELQWLRSAFHIDAPHFARIQEMHREFAGRCDLMCGKIAAANAKLEALISSNGSVTPEVSDAMKECMAVQNECRQSTLALVYAVRAEMPPADGARYLEMMKPRIIEPPLGHGAAISESSK